MSDRNFQRPMSLAEADASRNAVTQGITERQFYAKRVANLEAAVKAMAEVIQVLVAANAEERLQRLEETASRFRAYEVA